MNPKPSNNDQSTRWFTIDGCIRKNTKPNSEYPESERLFQCLLSTGSRDIDSLVIKATKIDDSYPLADILAIFSRINEALKGLSRSRATRALQPLDSKRFLPVTRHQHTPSYDRLVSTKDTPWFIADRPHLQESFRGKVPLLAFSPNELERMEGFIKGLYLNTRRLSEKTSCKTIPQGTLRYNRRLSDFIRVRAAFINQ